MRLFSKYSLRGTISAKIKDAQRITFNSLTNARIKSLAFTDDLDTAAALSMAPQPVCETIMFIVVSLNTFNDLTQSLHVSTINLTN